MYKERKYNPEIDDAPKNIPFMIKRENTVFDTDWVPLSERLAKQRILLRKQKIFGILSSLLALVMYQLESLYSMMDIVILLYLAASLYIIFTNKLIVFTNEAECDF